jgi:hypothetical protein
MADEYGKPPHNRDVGVPTAFNWQSLKSKRGAELEGHYIELLRTLSTHKGMLGQIFTKARTRACMRDRDFRRLPVLGEFREGVLVEGERPSRSAASNVPRPSACGRGVHLIEPREPDAAFCAHIVEKLEDRAGAGGRGRWPDCGPCSRARGPAARHRRDPGDGRRGLDRGAKARLCPGRQSHAGREGMALDDEWILRQHGLDVQCPELAPVERMKIDEAATSSPSPSSPPAMPIFR